MWTAIEQQHTWTTSITSKSGLCGQKSLKRKCRLAINFLSKWFFHTEENEIKNINSRDRKSTEGEREKERERWSKRERERDGEREMERERERERWREGGGTREHSSNVPAVQCCNNKSPQHPDCSVGKQLLRPWRAADDSSLCLDTDCWAWGPVDRALSGREMSGQQ